MAQNITLMGASYSAVPAVTLPKTGGGTASFTDVSDTTATAADVASGTYFYTAAGEYTEGTASGGGGGGDYTTANITLVNRTGMTFTYMMPSIVAGYLRVERSTLNNNASKSFVTPLYQGYTMINGVSQMQGYTVSGDNVEQIGVNFYITGDGTAIIENDL